jgi:serine/threonine-protein kinase
MLVVMEGGRDQETAPLAMTPPARITEPIGAPEGEKTTIEPVAASGSAVGSSIEALERDEILRTRTFCYLVMALSLVGGVVSEIIPGGDPLAKLILLSGCGIGLLSMVFLLYQTFDPVRFRQRWSTLIWIFPAISVNTAVLFFGVYSPAPMLVVLGIYFVGLGKSKYMAIFAIVFCSVVHLAMGLVTIFGGRDIGLAHPTLTVEQQIIIVVCEQFIMVLTYIIARISRGTALLAVSELEQAVRLAAHRQALLLEARDELERALRTKRGRFSDQVIGQYELGDVLGRGAMGEVYAATERRNGAEVAIKLLAPPSLGNANHVLRFFRELRTAAAVESPHVVRVIEIGEKPVPYLVMERLEGKTLSEILRERRTLPLAEVVELVAEIGIGITAAAKADIVHRDLKPQNIFRHHEVWKILDFGVARALSHGDTITAGQLVGTPSYMAPEQASGKPVDHRTDLYAVAAVAYRALTGHPPFASKEIADTLYKVVHTRPMRPSLLAPELPHEVDIVLAVGMSARPEDRFASAAELTEALREAARGHLTPAARSRVAALGDNAWASSLQPPRRAASHS